MMPEIKLLMHRFPRLGKMVPKVNNELAEICRLEMHNLDPENIQNTEMVKLI